MKFRHKIIHHTGVVKNPKKSKNMFIEATPYITKIKKG
jgi:hypothetical protein